jgi:hypothetical protein
MNEEPNPLIKVKEAISATKSILDEVIPELEDIAEHSRSELRSASLILQDGMACLKDSATGKNLMIQVIQHEHRGIPNEPFITLDYVSALKHYQQLLIEQGFRKMKEGEDFQSYTSEYDDTLEGYNSDLYPKFKSDDTVRWWDGQLL